MGLIPKRPKLTWQAIQFYTKQVIPFEVFPQRLKSSLFGPTLLTHVSLRQKYLSSQQWMEI